MIRAVVDTNVLVSALLFRGRASRIHSAWKGGRLVLLVDRNILDEYIRVLAYPKFGLDEETVGAILEKEILPFCEVVPVFGPPPDPVCRDLDDNKFLHCAVAATADMIVTGDSDLLDVGEHHAGIPILTVASVVIQLDECGKAG